MGVSIESRRRKGAVAATACSARVGETDSSTQQGRDTRSDLPTSRGHARCVARGHGRAARGQLRAEGRKRVASQEQRRLDGRARPGDAAGTVPATAHRPRDGVMSTDRRRHGH
jgi:hypothetical protein